MALGMAVHVFPNAIRCYTVTLKTAHTTLKVTGITLQKDFFVKCLGSYAIQGIFVLPQNLGKYTSSVCRFIFYS